MLGPALWLLWLLATIHLAPAGLVVGVISVTRQRTARAMRVAMLCLVVVGGAVAEFAAPSLTRDNAEVGRDFVHDGRLADVLIIVVAVLLVGTTFWVLPRMQRRLRTPAV